jgi:hypothetical protein
VERRRSSRGGKNFLVEILLQAEAKTIRGRRKKKNEGAEDRKRNRRPIESEKGTFICYKKRHSVSKTAFKKAGISHKVEM